MRAFKKFDKRGFTLVELMIVVAIIGVLAALAIYGVRRYLASAKTSEAKNTVGAIARGAAGAYERETAAAEIVAEGNSGNTANHALCTTAPQAVPDNITKVAGKKYQPNSAPGADFEAGDALTGWKCLKFSINSPIYYQYHYNAGAYPQSQAAAAPVPGQVGFEAAALGDLDGDGVPSYFIRSGEVNTTTGSIRLATQVHVANEFE